jgi:hypothetical protein
VDDSVTSVIKFILLIDCNFQSAGESLRVARRFQ